MEGESHITLVTASRHGVCVTHSPSAKKKNGDGNLSLIRLYIVLTTIFIYVLNWTLFYTWTGREYRLRLAFDAGLLENDAMAEILRRAQGAGARVRANLGTMLILMVPAFPTATVAAFIKELTINTKEYGITSIHISVPDSQEVCQR